MGLFSSRTQTQLTNIDKALRAGKMTPTEARDEAKLVRLSAIVDARRARANAPK